MLFLRNLKKMDVKCKGCFYIGQYPVRWTAQITLHFTPWQSCSFRHQLDFSGKHSNHAAITRNDYSLTFPSPSHSQILIHTAEWIWGIMERTKMHKLRNGNKWDSNPGSLDCESGILLLSNKACNYNASYSQKLQAFSTKRFWVFLLAFYLKSCNKIDS